MRTTSFAVRDVIVEETIRVSRARVWKALTRETGAWWPRGFWSLRGSRRMVLEPRLGGRMYEDAGRGQGLVWYSVTGLVEAEWILLSGEMSAQYGGPCRNLLSIRLEEKGGRTKVLLRETLYGRVTAKARSSMVDGWTTLLRALRAHAERRSR